MPNYAFRPSIKRISNQWPPARYFSLVYKHGLHTESRLLKCVSQTIFSQFGVPNLLRKKIIKAQTRYESQALRNLLGCRNVRHRLPRYLNLVTISVNRQDDINVSDTRKGVTIVLHAFRTRHNLQRHNNSSHGAVGVGVFSPLPRIVKSHCRGT